MQMWLAAAAPMERHCFHPALVCITFNSLLPQHANSQTKINVELLLLFVLLSKPQASKKPSGDKIP